MDISPPVEAFQIHFPAERQFLFSRAQSVEGTALSSPLEWYFSRQESYVELDYLTDYDTYNVLISLPVSLVTQ